MELINWIRSLDVPIQAALIAAFVTIFSMILKDVLFKRIEERRAERRQALDIYRNYADPLAYAATSLFWRVREILTQEGRGSFLKSSGAGTQFDRYKYESTLYRLAVLIGWLRAYRRELTLFSLSDPKKLALLNKAMGEFEKGLADGAHVEVQRVRSLAALWCISIPSDVQSLSRIAVAVEQTLKSSIQSESVDLAMSLTAENQKKLCRRVADVIAERMRIDPLSNNIIDETLARAIRSLSIREAWLYRDFQSAIGDMMIREVKDGARRYEVIGFRDFEALLLSNDEGDKRWITRLGRILDGLDITGADRFDARVQMIEETFLATIEMLEALAKIDPKRGSVSMLTLEEGRKFKRDRYWQKSK